MNSREAAVAGMFYPAKKEILEKQLANFFKNLKQRKKGEKTSAIIAPHAGYEYSGRIAAIAFNELKKAKTIILLGPNHTGLGNRISVSDSDYWETPLGKIPLDAELREKLLEKINIEADDSAHLQEHSIEVELPFLQFLFSDFKILPICLMENRLKELENLGKILAEISGNETSIVASSDFSHFLPLENAKEKDAKAIELIEKLDLEGFYRIVMQKQMSICGFSPITVAMQYCREKNYKKARLLEYDTSATSTGDKASVVAYAAIKFEK